MKRHLVALHARYPRSVRGLAFGWSVVRSLRKHNALEFASALAFTSFFSLVPLLALLGFVIGALVRRTGAEAVFGPFFEHAPEATRTVVLAGLDQLAGAHSSVAPLAVLGFLWIASSGAHGAMDVLELMLFAPARPYWRKRVLALVWVLGILAVGATAAALVVKLTTRIEEEAVLVDGQTQAERALGEGAEARPGIPLPSAKAAPSADKQKKKKRDRLLLRRRLVWIGGAASRGFTLLLVLGLSFLGLGGFYRIGVRYPKTHERRRIYPGAGVALVMGFIVSTAFAYYVAKLGSYVTYYGALATVAVLLFWLYLMAFAFLIGAEVNALLEGRRQLGTLALVPTSPYENAAVTSAKAGART